MKNKIIILGGSGQLGKCLNQQLKEMKHEVFSFSKDNLDVTNIHSLTKNIKNIKPDIIINASAYTDVDGAEKNTKYAAKINTEAVSNMAILALKFKAILIHVSTDYVFDGNSKIPYVEGDIKKPIGCYGATKLAGEEAVIKSGCKYIILRTSWLFSEYGNNFLVKILNASNQFSSLKIVDDQIGCPTYAQDLACAVIKIIDKGIDKSKIYHYGGDKPCSWFDFSVNIFKQANEIGLKSNTQLISVPSSEYKTLARRPKFSILNSNKIFHEYDITPSDWRLGIKNSLISLIKSQGTIIS